MSIIVSQSELKSALSIVAKAIPSRPTHPVLANVLLETLDSGKLRLVGFDLSMGIETVIDAQILTEFKLTIPCRMLLNIIAHLPDGAVTLSCNENRLIIDSGNGKFEISGLPSEEYPELPQINQNSAFELDSEALRDGIKNCAFSASNDQTKQVLTGINLFYDDDKLKFAATDGHRLSVFKKEIEFDQDLNVTIPAQTLKELSAFLAEDLTVAFDDGQVQFTTGDFILKSRILEGTYPAYQQLVPTQFSRKFVVTRSSFVNAVEVVGVLMNDKNNVVKVAIDADKKQLIISADAKEIGYGNQAISADITGESCIIGLNAKYLLEGLKAINSNEVAVSLNEPQQPVILQPLNGEDFTYLVMPVQIRD